MPRRAGFPAGALLREVLGSTASLLAPGWSSGAPFHAGVMTTFSAEFAAAFLNTS